MGAGGRGGGGAGMRNDKGREKNERRGNAGGMSQRATGRARGEREKADIEVGVRLLWKRGKDVSARETSCEGSGKPGGQGHEVAETMDSRPARWWARVRVRARKREA